MQSPDRFEVRPHTPFANYLAKKQHEHGDRFCSLDLNPIFIPHYDTRMQLGVDYRIKVRLGSGEEKWGFVGVTTGWRPSFLLIGRTGQHGSSVLLDKDCTIVGSKRLKKR